MQARDRKLAKYAPRPGARAFSYFAHFLRRMNVKKMWSSMAGLVGASSGSRRISYSLMLAYEWPQKFEHFGARLNRKRSKNTNHISATNMPPRKVSTAH